MKNRIDFYKGLQPFLTCKDHTVSREKFEVKINTTYDMLVTTPVPKNISKYYQSDKYISHTDAKKTLFDKVYQLVRKIALSNKLRLLNSFKTNSNKVLDIGAGTGDFLKVCKNNSWKVFGMEPSQKAREIASKKGIELQAELSAFKNQKFDVITLWHVLEHVENLESYIHNLESLLSKNGVLLIAVPNYKSYDAKYYKQHWAAFDVPRHLWHFSETSISKLFSEVNLKVQKVYPMKFDAYYVSLLSEKYKNGKTKLLSAIWTGFTSNRKAKASKQYSSLIYILKR